MRGRSTPVPALGESEFGSTCKKSREFKQESRSADWPKGFGEKRVGTKWI
jgi:hypothetical protein